MITALKLLASKKQLTALVNSSSTNIYEIHM